MTPAELGQGWLSKTISGGDQVAGQVTLDLCGGGYPSEALRTARLQTAYRKGAVEMSNEVVRYSAGGAEQAYQEVVEHAAQCPSTPVLMPEENAGKVRFTITKLAHSPSWVRDTFAAKVRITQGGRSETSLVIYQFSGDWMSAEYGYSDTPKAIAATRELAALAAMKLRKDTASATV